MGASRSQPDPERIFEEAVGFAVRLQGDPLNPVVLEALGEWQARGPEERRAWAEISQIHGLAGKALSRAARPKEGMGRRAFLWGGIGLGGLALWHKGPDLARRWQADLLTAKGEFAEIELAGARLTLGPGSALALDREAGQARLLAGLIMSETQGASDLVLRGDGFELHPDGPALIGLSVEAGQQMLGLDAGFASVWLGRGAAAGERRMAAGDWLRLSGDLAEFGQQEIGHAGAWRENRLIVEGERLEALVGRIGRWLPGEVVLADPWLGRQRVSGVFDLSDPLRALEAALAPLGGRMRRAGDWLTVITRV